VSAQRPLSRRLGIFARTFRRDTPRSDVATLCSGTREPEDMWRGHPENAEPEFWSDMRDTLDVLLNAAAGAGIRLGIEPEPGNLVRDAVTAARLLDELGADAPIGIVFHSANLLSPADIGDQAAILTHAIDLLGQRIIGAHAKDIAGSGPAAAGRGNLDYHLVFRLLARLPPVPVIAQGVPEADAPRVHDDLLRWEHEPAGGDV
jgi:sugar phosphate isomerase/epimerase